MTGKNIDRLGPTFTFKLGRGQEAFFFRPHKEFLTLSVRYYLNRRERYGAEASERMLSAPYLDTRDRRKERGTFGWCFFFFFYA